MSLPTFVWTRAYTFRGVAYAKGDVFDSALVTGPELQRMIEKGWLSSSGGTGAVTSVAGRTGAVTGAQIATDPALSGTYAPLASPHFTGSPLVNGSPIGSGSGVDASDIGYDVIVIAGQSNAVGYGHNVDTVYDTVDPQIWQWASVGTYAGQIVQASEPLWSPDSLAITSPTHAVGPGLPFARSYVRSIPVNRKILLVPTAYGATGLVGAGWDPAGPGANYTQAISLADAAMAAAGAHARLAAIIWCQGESDASGGVTGAAYGAKLDALITAFRANITGASATTPVLILGMVPTWVAGPTGTSVAIAAALAATPSGTAYTAYTPGASGAGEDSGGIHYTAAQQRLNGTALYGILATAQANTPTAPGQVTGLAATAGATQAALSWTVPASHGSAIIDYLIEYKLTSSGTWSVFADGTSTSAAATVTGLTASVSYDFRVSATNAVGTGTASATASATPTAAATVPGTPTSASASAGNAQATITFTAPGSNGGSTITGYTATSTPGSHTGSISGASAAPITVTGLTNGTAYTFTVHATNAIGSSAESAASASVTPAAPTVPGAPTGLTATAGVTQVVLSWAAPASNGGSALTDYVVQYRTPNGSGGWSTFSHSASTTTGATVTGLTGGSVYGFQVAAVNAIGTSAFTSEATATPTAAGLPVTSGLVVRLDSGTLVLSDGAAVSTWADSSGNGYDVTQATGGNRPVYKVAIVNGKPVVRFDGVNDYLTRAYNAAYNTTDWSFFAVTVPRGGAGNYRGIASSFSASPHSGWTMYLSNANAYQAAVDNGTTSIFTGTGSTPVGTACVLATVRGSASTAVFLNGSAAGSNSGGFVAATTAPLVIGANALTLDFPMNGDIAEILLYSRAVNSAERASVTSYLGTKYGITVV